MKKKIITVAVLCAVLIAMIVVYFAVVAPMTKEDEELPQEEIILLEGESLGPNNRIYLYPIMEKSNVSEIHICNETSNYAFYREDDGEFYIKGSRNTPYDTSAFETEILACSRNAIAIQRVSEDESDLAKFGLDSDKCYYEITDDKNNTYKVYIGDMIVTGAGYYCRAEGRNAVYIMDSGYGSFLKDECEILSPLLSLQMTEEDYYLCQHSEVWRDGELFYDIDYQDKDDRALNGTTTQYYMNYPEGYTPSTTKYQEILQILADFQGTKVLDFGNSDDVLPKETLAKYSLDNPKYIVSYTYNDIENTVLLSTQNEDGTFNAYSMLFNTVVLVDEETAGFVNWDILPLIDRSIFQMSIINLKEMEIDIGDGNVRKFLPQAGTENLEALFDGNGNKFSDFDMTNFKKLYMKMLEIKLEDYTGSTLRENKILSFKATSLSGKTYEYAFYAYSTRRCFFTINGEGEFYCLRDSVELVINNLIRFEEGTEIDTSAKN